MLRYYEAQGLLDPGRHPNGYRDYSEPDLRRVETIRDLSASGVPTRFIRIVLDRERNPRAWTAACDDTLADMIREQLVDLDAKIACLTASRDSLTDLLRDARRPTTA